MRNPLGSRVIVAGIAGIILGIAGEALINHIAGTIVVTDGMLWGAMLAILVVSLPNFTGMGSLTVRSDKPAINFIVGIGVFILLSLVVVALFFGIFWLIGRFVP